MGLSLLLQDQEVASYFSLAQQADAQTESNDAIGVLYL